MKEIRKIFNIKEKKEGSSFTIGEVIIIAVTLIIFSSILTGILVNRITEKNILEDVFLADIRETYQTIIKKYYVDVNKEKLANAAIDGMMNYLDENYSSHMSDDQTEDLEDRLKGKYTGIGIEIVKDDDKVMVYRVYEGSPAEKVGLKAGDYILKIDDFIISPDTALEDVTLEIVNKKKIKMKILREDKEKDLDIQIDTVTIPVVSSKTFEKNDKLVGYIYLEAFSANAYAQFKSHLEDLEKKNIDSLIVDVRSNTGGYLTSVNDIASMFLKKGEVIYSLETKGEKTATLDKTKETRTYPIVVLIDRITASASEVLAAALKESYGATLIGTQSFGKGKVQQINKLNDDTLVKYTTAKWYTPNGDSVEGVGLTPGISVYLDEEYQRNPSDETDKQLQKALEFISVD